MFGDLLHLLIVLQEGTGDVERDIGAIDHAVQQHQKFRDDFLDVIRDIYLIAIQLDLSALELHLLFHLGEIEDALQAERILHVQVDPEERLVEVHERIAVEGLVLLFRALLGLFEIERVRIVDGLIVLSLGIQVDLIRHEGAIFAQEIAHDVLFEELLLFLGKVHDDLRPARLLVAVADRISGVAVRFPMHADRALFIRLREDLDILGDHIGGIEPKSEMPDDAVAACLFVFIDEIRSARKSDLRDVLFHLVFGHADAVVLNGQRLCVFVDGDFQAIVFAALIFRRFAHPDGVF